MSRVAYVNGRYVAHRDASVHVEDRGYQFSDGVYEVIAVHGGRLVDEEPHLDRLDRSLTEIRLAWPISRAALRQVLRRMIVRNRITDRGLVYLQVTRGVAPRNHLFPASARPSLVMTARPLPPFDRKAATVGVSVVTLPDLRWRRCDIKSVSLLANVLAKQQAAEAGAYEAWMVDPDGYVTEGTSSNAWIVSRGGELITRDPTAAILNGITRQSVIRCAEENGLRLVERPFTVAEAKLAAEAFVTSTSSLVKPVVRIDDTPIGNGEVGPITLRAVDVYANYLSGPAAGN